MTLSYIKLLGHRGMRAEVLENSELGFAYAQNLVIDGKRLAGVEFDIQMTADGEFVVVHDETLQRLANAQSWIADKTLAELLSIYQSDSGRFQAHFNPDFLQQPILPLTAILPYLQGYQHIELEIKTHAKSQPQTLVRNLLRLLSDKSWQDLPITLTSFDTEILSQLQIQQQFLPWRFATGLLLEPNAPLASQIAFLPLPNRQGERLIADTFNRACRLGCRQVGVYYPLITPALLATAKQLGLTVTAWTVNDVEVARKLVNMGVDCVITDMPALFLKTL